MILAVGGPATMKGSLAEKHKASVTLRREDDTNKMKKDLLKYASAMASGAAAGSDGVACVTIMGDGAAQFFADINPTLEKLGPDYRAEIVGITGYSHGEDKLMGPPKWKDSPATMRAVRSATPPAPNGTTILMARFDSDWACTGKAHAVVKANNK